MDYSDNIYFSRFAVDPESDLMDPELSDEFQLFEAPAFDRLGDEMPTDFDDCQF